VSQARSWNLLGPESKLKTPVTGARLRDEMRLKVAGRVVQKPEEFMLGDMKLK
jgi:hypothetical protein